MKRILYLLLLLLFCLSACRDDDSEHYPSIITEMVIAQADGQGQLSTIICDRGQTYKVSNGIAGLKANERVRALVGYVIQEDGRVQVYTAQVVPVLSDASEEEKLAQDPTGIESVWQGGGFLNFHFLPKTRGGQQGWAFLRDSIHANILGGTNYYLSLYHDQMEDVEAYSAHFYACVSQDSIASSFTATDSVVFAVCTYDGIQIWRFGELTR